MLWAIHSHIQAQKPSLAASTLSFVMSLMLCALSYMEHSRSLRPSTLLNGYLFVTLIFDAIILRTLWLSSFNTSIRDLYTASFALRAIITLLEAKEKRSYFNAEYKQTSPEESSGLYSQSLFWWLNSLIMRGARHILKSDDLYPISDDISSKILNTAFWKAWNIRKTGSRFLPKYN